jgi:hypothetical protein
MHASPHTQKKYAVSKVEVPSREFMKPAIPEWLYPSNIATINFPRGCGGCGSSITSSSSSSSSSIRNDGIEWALLGT